MKIRNLLLIKIQIKIVQRIINTSYGNKRNFKWRKKISLHLRKYPQFFSTLNNKKNRNLSLRGKKNNNKKYFNKRKTIKILLLLIIKILILIWSLKNENLRKIKNKIIITFYRILIIILLIIIIYFHKAPLIRLIIWKINSLKISCTNKIKPKIKFKKIIHKIKIIKIHIKT